MLTANKSVWFEKIFAVYCRNLFRRRFNSLNVSGLEKLLNRNKSIPTIIYSNHSSWWDGLVFFQISQKSNLDLYVMMEEKQLKDLQLFRRLGAFSIIREDPKSVIKSINYSVRILREKPNKSLLIFPQGKILPNDLRPIKFFNGISKIIEKIGNCQIFSTSIRYEFLGNYKPDIFVRIEKIDTFIVKNIKTSKVLTDELANKMTSNLDKLKSHIEDNKLENYQNII